MKMNTPFRFLLLLLAISQSLALKEKHILTDDSKGNGTFTSGRLDSQGNLNSDINISMVISEELGNLRLEYVPSAEENTTFNYFKELEQIIITDLHNQDPKVKFIS